VPRRSLAGGRLRPVRWDWGQRDHLSGARRRIPVGKDLLCHRPRQLGRGIHILVSEGGPQTSSVPSLDCVRGRGVVILGVAVGAPLSFHWVSVREELALKQEEAQSKTAATDQVINVLTRQAYTDQRAVAARDAVIAQWNQIKKVQAMLNRPQRRSSRKNFQREEEGRQGFIGVPGCQVPSARRGISSL
jgi:hypothetical protein